METLENDFLFIQIKNKGAEICSIFNKQARVEHLWQANPDVWSRHAPILFPIVGQINGGTFENKNQTFKLSQHGFARDMDFKLINKFEDSLVYELKSSGETLTHYPWDFNLVVKYTLKENQLEIRYKVENTDSDKLYFSIGAHPGFNCPFSAEENFEDYYLEFSSKETSDRILFQNGVLTGDVSKNYLNETREIPLSYDLFKDDALIFENLQSNKITLKSRKNFHFVEVGFEGFPYLGIWSKPNAKAPFVCIEPWFGITDTKNDEQDFKDKRGRLSLDPEQKFECSFSVTVG